MEGTFDVRSDAATAIEAPRTRPQGSPFGRITSLYDSIAARRYGFPVTVFIVHWLIVQVTATLAYVYGAVRLNPDGTIGSSQPYSGNFPYVTMHGFWENIVGPMRLWDGLWYKFVAEHNYSTMYDATAAFWPLFPWVMRQGSSIFGLQTEVVGYLFSNLCFLGALIVLNQLLRMDFDAELTRKTLWAIALFPTALFFTAVYTEGPFLFFAALCLLCARKGEWPAAGVVGLLAALTRSQGVMLLAPLGILLIQQNNVDVRKWIRTAPFAALPILGPVIFGWKLHSVGLKWRSFIDVQNEWYRTGSNPVHTLSCAIRGCQFRFTVYGQVQTPYAHAADWSWFTNLIHHFNWNFISGKTWLLNTEYNNWRDSVARSDTMELVVTIAFLVIAVVGLFKLPLWQSAYVWPPLIVPLFQPSSVHPLYSMPRFVLVLFPLFVILAMFFEGRALKTAGVIVSTVLLVLLTIQFSTWYWVS